MHSPSSLSPLALALLGQRPVDDESVRARRNREAEQRVAEDIARRKQDSFTKADSEIVSHEDEVVKQRLANYWKKQSQQYPQDRYEANNQSKTVARKTLANALLGDTATTPSEEDVVVTAPETSVPVVAQKTLPELEAALAEQQQKRFSAGGYLEDPRYGATAATAGSRGRQLRDSAAAFDTPISDLRRQIAEMSSSPEGAQILADRNAAELKRMQWYDQPGRRWIAESNLPFAPKVASVKAEVARLKGKQGRLGDVIAGRVAVPNTEVIADQPEPNVEPEAARPDEPGFSLTPRGAAKVAANPYDNLDSSDPYQASLQNRLIRMTQMNADEMGGLKQRQRARDEAALQTDLAARDKIGDNKDKYRTQSKGVQKRGTDIRLRSVGDAVRGDSAMREYEDSQTYADAKLVGIRQAERGTTRGNAADNAWRRRQGSEGDDEIEFERRKREAANRRGDYGERGLAAKKNSKPQSWTDEQRAGIENSKDRASARSESVAMAVADARAGRPPKEDSPQEYLKAYNNIQLSQTRNAPRRGLGAAMNGGGSGPTSQESSEAKRQYDAAKTPQEKMTVVNAFNQGMAQRQSVSDNREDREWKREQARLDRKDAGEDRKLKQEANQLTLAQQLHQDVLEGDAKVTRYEAYKTSPEYESSTKVAKAEHTRLLDETKAETNSKRDRRKALMDQPEASSSGTAIDNSFPKSLRERMMPALQRKATEKKVAAKKEEEQRIEDKLISEADILIRRNTLMEKKNDVMRRSASGELGYNEALKLIKEINAEIKAL